MSSLKDIMDVDVEPLEGQALRRSMAAVQQQASPPLVPATPETPLPQTDDIDKGKTSSTKGRRSNRVSKSSTSSQSTASQHTLIRRRSSAQAEGMDFSGYQAGGSNQASTSGSPQRSSRGSEPAMDVPVKYTPITGRISRAKKGVPVHTCDLCRPIKTFTRAEHLRRHQLSHQKPAYPCTFEDCERAFHRPDLLARHLHRHETQGEKAFKLEDPRSRGSSQTSEGRSPLTIQPPSSMSTTATQGSPADSLTPRTSGSGGSAMTASSFETITGNFQSANFQTGSGHSHKRSASEAQLGESAPFSTISPVTGLSRAPRGYDQMSGQSYAPGGQISFDNVYSERATSSYQYPSTPQLPLLQIPEENWLPGLSRNNSPWCSSASDSTYSTQSDNSRTGHHWAHRGRSASIATLPDWPAQPTAWSPHGVSTTPQDLRSPPYDSIMDSNYEPSYTPPRVTPPITTRGQLLDVPVSYGGFFLESVGTPAPSTYIKPMAQRFSASPSRMSRAGLERRKKSLVEHRLGTFTMVPTSSFTSTTQSQLDIYINSYWQSFHPLFPIVHRPTFASSNDTILFQSMAAIGSQYINTPEARKKGSELNELCKKNIELCLNWDLATMQAILLTEFFTRFRGRKTNVRLSRPFENLYLRLVKESGQDRQIFYDQDPGTAPSADSILDRFGGHGIAPAIAQQTLDSENEWHQWLLTETRQRLLNACFMFDTHQSTCHEQPRSNSYLDSTGLILLPSSDDLWNACSATEWQALAPNYPQPQHVQLAGDDLFSTQNFSPFVQSLLICWFTARLPARENPMYPNNFYPQSASPTLLGLMNAFPASPQAHTYLSLYHTPLRDLLAVAGDTWVFSRKISQPEEFHAAQSRLRLWSTSFPAAQATYHACHVLSSAFSAPDSSNFVSLSDYWNLYMAALVCWSFGHKHQNFPNTTNLSHNSSSTELGIMDSDESPVSDSNNARIQTLEYTRGMLELGVEDLLTSKATMRGDTYGVIDAARLRLELESVGDRCGMLVDAIAVLSKIKKGRREKWF